MYPCTQLEFEEIMENHKAWLKSRRNGGRGFLSKADLTKIDLRGVDFSRVDLDQADLSGQDFTGINLKGANLYQTNLTDATGLVIPKVGKAYKLLYSDRCFYTKNENTYVTFEKGEAFGLILEIRGTQNENHLNLYDQRRSSFDLLFLSGNRKGQIWREIDWYVLLANIGEEVGF